MTGVAEPRVSAFKRNSDGINQRPPDPTRWPDHKGEKKMFIERKFAEAMFLITGLMACLTMAVILTTPGIGG
jgi:hypothetical protein